MAIVLSVLDVDPTGGTFGLANIAADGFTEMQVSIRPDFKFCVAPIFIAPRVGPVSFAGINQDTSYYARARSLRGDGSHEAWSNIVGFRTELLTPRNVAPAAVMIKPAVLVVPAPVLQWDCANADPGFPAVNLGFDAPVPMVTNTLSPSLEIRVNISPEPIDTVAVLNTNFPEAAQMYVLAGDTNAVDDYIAGPFPARASANLDGRPGYHSLIRLPEPKLYPWWDIYVSGASPPGNVWHVEHVVFGRNRVSKNHSYEKAESTLDLGSLDRSRSGVPSRANGYRMRKVDFDLSMMSEAQYETQYGDLHWRVGGTDPVLVVPNSKDGAFLHDRILYGAISAGRVVNPASPVYTRSFTIDSLI
jgi:hypothetical protein